MSTTYNIEFVRGNTLQLPCQYLSNSVPVDITAALIVMTFKADFSLPDSQAIFQATTNNGDIVITDAVNGKFTITIPPALTKDLEAFNLSGVYDVEIKLSNGVVITLLSGTITIDLNVTRNI